MTAEELQTKRDALISKIAAATRSLQTGDTSITYQSIEAMQLALATLDSEIASASGSAITRTTYGGFSRG
jgi:hypothetical protein